MKSSTSFLFIALITISLSGRAAFAQDCNGNGVPDGDDLASGFSVDCNGNGIPDECDISGGTSLDCQANGVPDECELAAGNGLAGAYYDKLEFQGPVKGRIDPVIDFQGGAGWPGLGVDGDTFSVRWTGYLVMPSLSGTYTFTTFTDDGVRLWVNGQLLIDKWIPQMAWWSGSLDLQADERYWVVLEYFEQGGGETCRLYWQPPGMPQEIIPTANLIPSYDCNSNGIPDDCDIASGTSVDLYLNGVPDECEGMLDCNGNGIPDDEDFAGGTSQDCNANSVPDECEIAWGWETDCDESGVPDSCEGLIAAAILYVDSAAAGSCTGLTWADAFPELRTALCLAASNPIVEEIRVAAGTYRPAPPGGMRSATLHLLNNVGIYGGYAGSANPGNPDERDIVLHATILSGDLNGDDDGWNNRDDNSYHVVTAYGTNSTPVLDGFTVTGGYASVSGTADANGAGANIIHSSAPTISNCRFMANRAVAHGAGMYVAGTPALVNCAFENNWSGSNGGGLVCSWSTPRVVHNCTFVGNEAYYGGGAYFDHANPPVVNCTFIGNTATNRGSAISLNFDSNPTMTNCTFAANHSLLRGAVDAYYAQPALANSIAWGNTSNSQTGEAAQVFMSHSGLVSVNYSCIEGWTGALGGTGNHGADPLFADAEYRLGAGSPCIDAGDDTAVPADLADLDGDGDTAERTPVDLAGAPRFADDPDTLDTGVADPPTYPEVVDMGAHEVQVGARTWYVDDNAPNDPAPGDPAISDPLENGTAAHPFDAIQEAISAAADGDEIVVMDGTYTGLGNRDIDFAGKAILVRSQNGPAGCIVDCQDQGRGFLFRNGEGPQSALRGMTITHGRAMFGGGVYCDGGAAPIIADCRIRDCRADFGTMPPSTGGGIYCAGPALITNCEVAGNTSDYHGAGLFLGSATAVNCLVSCNAPDGIGVAGSATIANCTVVANGGVGILTGMYPYGSGAAVVNNSIIRNNLGAPIYVWYAGSSAIVGYTNLEGAWPGVGNIDADPLFVDPDGLDDDPATWQDNDYRLGAGSPCIEAADNTAVPADAADVDGDGDFAERTPVDLNHGPRFVDLPQVPDTGVADPPAYPEVVDMGAYETLRGPVVWHVDDDATGSGTGADWANAFTNLQAALALAVAGDSIWVASGTYRPAEPDGNRTVAFQIAAGVNVYGGFDGTEAELAERAGLFDQTILSGDLNEDDGPNFMNTGENSYHVVGIDDGATVTLDGFTIRGGNANGVEPNEDGGGVHVPDGTITLVNCALVENQAIDDGGGLRVREGQAIIQNCSFTGNQAGWGGGLRVHGDVDFLIADCTFTANIASDSGGGALIYVTASAIISNCTFTDNQAQLADSWGGGAMVARVGSVEFVGCTFTTNQAATYGGAITSDAIGLEIRDCTFSGNAATFGGAVMTWYASTCEIEDSSFGDNHATQDGGAVAASQFAGPGTIRNCVFTGNVAGDDGGAFRISDQTQARIENCLMMGNTAADVGGAIYVWAESSVEVVNCVAASNVGGFGGMVGLLFGNGGSQPPVASLTNTTSVGNTATEAGGAVYVEAATEVNLDNCVIRDSGPEPIAGEGTTIATFSNIQGGWPGVGNIDADPLFLDPDGPDNDPNTWTDNDYRLGPTSPCIDAGNSAAAPADASSDLDGLPRFVNDPLTPDTGVADPPARPHVVDMGAYEYVAGDLNWDGFADAVDWAAFANCLAGPEVATPAGGISDAVFRKADLSGDADVDVEDFAGFQRVFGGAATASPPGMVLIPAGEFQMGDTFTEGDSAERPVHAVSVGAFFMDSYEVTKVEWDAVRAWGLVSGYTDLYAAGGKEANHPVHSVNWFDCVKWCNARSEQEGRTPCYYTDVGLTTVYRTGEIDPYIHWNSNGYRLPTEAEWEKAARGGVAGHRFPWSDVDTIQHALANYRSHWLGGAPYYLYDTNATEGYHPTFAVGPMPYTSPVGYFAANGLGLYDVAGNVREWCGDWYSDTYYSSSPYNNPRGPTSGMYRVLRGGSWSGNAFNCRMSHRYNLTSTLRYNGVGLRCAVGTP